MYKITYDTKSYITLSKINYLLESNINILKTRDIFTSFIKKQPKKNLDSIVNKLNEDPIYKNLYILSTEILKNSTDLKQNQINNISGLTSYIIYKQTSNDKLYLLKKLLKNVIIHIRKIKGIDSYQFAKLISKYTEFDNTIVVFFKNISIMNETS